MSADSRVSGDVLSVVKFLRILEQVTAECRIIPRIICKYNFSLLQPSAELFLELSANIILVCYSRVQDYS